jgi:hypothetical protein
LIDLSSTDDFRLFCGDLGNEVNDDILTKAFSKYPSFNMARVSLDHSIIIRSCSLKSFALFKQLMIGGLFCTRLYGTSGLVKLKDMDLLVLLMHQILLLP